MARSSTFGMFMGPPARTRSAKTAEPAGGGRSAISHKIGGFSMAAKPALSSSSVTFLSLLIELLEERRNVLLCAPRITRHQVVLELV